MLNRFTLPWRVSSFFYTLVTVFATFLVSLGCSAQTIDSNLPDLHAAAQNIKQTSYFYHGQEYGSESQFGPLNVFINVGYVVPGRLRTTANLADIRYKKGWHNVLDSLSHQEDVFDESGGFKASLKKEFIPFAHPSGAWLPNYGLHFLGEGMLSRKLEEYFRYNGVQGEYAPKLLAVSTVVAAQLMNEVVEYELPWEQRLDSVADFYFNMAGIIAFSYDGFAEYFSNEQVEYYYWAGQPVIDEQGALFNQGENYFLRFGEGWKYAFMMGVPANGLGISYPLDNMEHEHISIMLGSDVLIPKRSFDASEEAQRVGEFVAADIAKEYTAAINLYWDRKGSLLASSSLSFSPSWQLSINVYPEKRWGLGFAMGGYGVVSEKGANTIGITFDFMPLVPGFRH